MCDDRDTSWQFSANSYLRRLCEAEWRMQKCPVPTKRNRRNRYCPSQYVNDLVALLGRNDEAGFKALKLLQGYASALGV